MAPELYVELPAVPGAAGRSRRETVRWLEALCGADRPCDAVADLVLAVNEAVSNSIEHAYRGDPSGTVVLRGAAAPGPDRPGCAALRVTVEVSDRGSWRPPPRDPGFRGRGLSMIRACAEDVVVDARPSGTTVTMRGTVDRCEPPHGG